jgi:hypothetical protein
VDVESYPTAASATVTTIFVAKSELSSWYDRNYCPRQTQIVLSFERFQRTTISGMRPDPERFVHGPMKSTVLYRGRQWFRSGQTIAIPTIVAQPYISFRTQPNPLCLILRYEG